MTNQYIGEHLLPGILGKAWIGLSLLSLLVSIYLFVRATWASKAGKKKERWAGRFFILHFAALLAAIGTLYYVIANHYFEYAYVWQYSSKGMPAKFMISCFWAGQEGSFLIWAFFTGMLGMFLLFLSKSWKSWVLPVYSVAQLFLLVMVLGIHVFGLKIGESPFALLREMAVYAGDDFFRQPGYLSQILDGRGLNPLLENYWMVIHPPALFLGYAAVFVPASYAVASLWRKSYHAWIRPALPWTAFALLTLGVGILLGGRWAYESLAFGGFWAWDPVENASLIPWLFLAAAFHLLLIVYKRRHSYRTAYLLVFFSCFFVLYATYLTRSGVLGQTSVHSFGENSQSALLLIFTLLFLFIPLGLWWFRNKHIPRKKGKDILFSREFWMLLGSIILMLSAFQIITTTSIPVFNRIFGLNLAPPLNAIDFYNHWQLPFAVLTLLTIAVSQYFWYGQKALRGAGKKLLRAGCFAILCTAFVAFIGKINRFDYLLLLFSASLVLCTSLVYIKKYVRYVPNVASAITHLGFALFVIGILLAFTGPQVISQDKQSRSSDHDGNVVLYKGKPKTMGNYRVTFSDTRTQGSYEYYQIDFVKKSDSLSGKVAFSLWPSTNFNNQMGKVNHPDTKHFLTKDIYTYISFSQQAGNESLDVVREMNVKDTLAAGDYGLVLDSVQADLKNNDFENVTLTAKFSLLDAGRRIIAQTQAEYRIRDGRIAYVDARLDSLGIELRFAGVSETSAAIRVAVSQKAEEYIVLKTVVFPFINLLWAGAVVMFLGLVYSIYRRSRKTPEAKNESKLTV